MTIEPTAKDQLQPGCNFDCHVCPTAQFGFDAVSGTGRLMKFPPGIGCQSVALMAFVGFNPRVSKTNRALHHELMTDRNAFVRLESNRTGIEPYIAVGGKERHYRTHAMIAEESIRGTDYEGRAFEEVAVATELFLCATEKPTSALRRALSDGSAECPKRHCWPVLHRAVAKVIVALGDDVFNYLRRGLAYPQEWTLSPQHRERVRLDRHSPSE